ncbi:MAG: discoidin domain-containing protein, partial [Flavobacteriales bacterium]|nr:discoidin domain-containing protein [Flavobacteriales bacterium]
LVVNVPTEIKLVPQPGSGFSSGELPVGFFAPHKACGASLAFNYDISPSYTGGGQTGLVNGRLGGTSFRDEGWQGVQGSDVEVIADLGSEQSVSYICSRWYHYTNAWIFRPESVNYFISPDGKNWEKLPEVTGIADIKAEGELILPAWINIGPKNARYVKMVAHSVGPCPEWHDAAGSSSWLFCDELIVK